MSEQRKCLICKHLLKLNARTIVCQKCLFKANNYITSEIEILEGKYGMTTANMLQAVQNGKMPDNIDIVRWLILSKIELNKIEEVK